MRVAKYNSSEIDDMFRIIKAFVRTREDVQTAFQLLPPGEDSQPIENEDVIISDTANDETVVVVGVIQRNQKSGPGEKRFYARSEDGTEVVDIWMRANGDIEISGTGDFFARFNELKTGFDTLTTDHNGLVARVNEITTLLKTWTTAPNDGGAALKAAAVAQFTTDIDDSEASIDNAKIENLKTANHGS